MEWMHNCHHVSVWNYSAWFIDSELVKFCILLPASYSCVWTHVSGERILCSHRKARCILSFTGLTQRDSTRNLPWKTSPCWVFRGARSAQSWGERREGLCVSLWQTEEKVVSALSCYCWDNLSKLAVFLWQIYITARFYSFLLSLPSGLPIWWLQFCWVSW